MNRNTTFSPLQLANGARIIHVQNPAQLGR
jgi:hypothetical protein